MKTDTYTKSVLTVIALCLVLHVLHSFSLFTTATASAFDQPSYVLAPVNEDGSMNVRLIAVEDDATIDVNIAGCESNALYYAGAIEVRGTVQTD